MKRHPSLHQHSLANAKSLISVFGLFANHDVSARMDTSISITVGCDGSWVNTLSPAAMNSMITGLSGLLELVPVL